MDTILTAEGAARLEEQLEHLKTVARKEIAEQIRVAREFGDISENAEYDEAKNEQARIEGQIVDLEKKLRTARIVTEEELNSGNVMIGSKVDIEDDKGNTFHLTIGGSTDADPMNGVITNESPLGAALLGQHAGSEMDVATPLGIKHYKILAIS